MARYYFYEEKYQKPVKNPDCLFVYSSVPGSCSFYERGGVFSISPEGDQPELFYDSDPELLATQRELGLKRLIEFIDNYEKAPSLDSSGL